MQLDENTLATETWTNRMPASKPMQPTISRELSGMDCMTVASSAEQRLGSALMA